MKSKMMSMMIVMMGSVVNVSFQGYLASLSPAFYAQIHYSCFPFSGQRDDELIIRGFIIIMRTLERGSYG